MGKAKLQFNNGVWWLRRWSKMIYGCSAVTPQRFYKGYIKKQTGLCQFGLNFESFKTNHTQLLLLSFIVKVGLPPWWSSRSLTLRNTGVIPSVHLSGLNLESHRFFFLAHMQEHTRSAANVIPCGWRRGMKIGRVFDVTALALKGARNSPIHRQQW